MKENIRDKLNKAIDDGNVTLADQLAAQLVPEQIPPMPEGFAENIQRIAEKSSASKHHPVKRTHMRYKRRPVILAAALVLLLAFATIAYAAGLLQPSVGFKDGTSTTINAALDSNEYKAASEYADYIHQNYKELEKRIFDPVDYPIYADTAKVKELSKKYHLSYATKRQDIKSLDKVAAALSDNKVPNFLGTALSGAKADSVIFDDMTAFLFNDGNFYLSYSLPSGKTDLGDTVVDVSYTPKGTFPWSGFCLSPGEGIDSLNSTQSFTYKTKNSLEFICTPIMANERRGEITGYTCFGSIDTGYITVNIGRLVSKASNAEYEAQCKAVDKEYNKKAKKKLGIDLKELSERVVFRWNKIAWDKEPKAMEKTSLVSTDPKEADEIYARLEAKYSTATKAEKRLYSQWQDSLDTCGEKYGLSSPVSHDDLASLLEKFKLE